MRLSQAGRLYADCSPFWGEFFRLRCKFFKRKGGDHICFIGTLWVKGGFKARIRFLEKNGGPGSQRII